MSDIIDQILSARAGDRIRLPEGSLEIREPLQIPAGVSLIGLGCGATFKLVELEATLVLKGGSGACLENFEIQGHSDQIAPALSISDSTKLTIAKVRIVGAGSTALSISNVKSLGIDVHIQDAGLSGVEIDQCDHLAASILLNRCGLRARVAGLSITDCSDFNVALSAKAQSGPALAIRSRNSGARRGLVCVEAIDCYRGISLIGERTNPVTDLSASIKVGDAEDCGVLITNVERAHLVHIPTDDGPAAVVRSGGGHGFRSSTLVTPTRPADGALAGLIGTVVLTASPRPQDLRAFSTIQTKASQADFEPHFVVDVCRVCGWSGKFRRTQKSIRETFQCGACRASLRYRAQADALLSVLGAPKEATLDSVTAGSDYQALAVYEPGISGPLRPYLSRAKDYTKSFYWEGLRSGDLRGDIEHQDLTATSFPDNRFDLVVSSDIFEHVRHPALGFREIERILRPGGYHVFTVPAVAPLPPETISRVDVSGSEDILLLPAVYHGSGDGGRSLVYNDFGADLLDQLNRSGFETTALAYQSEDELCASALTFVSRKTGS